MKSADKQDHPGQIQEVIRSIVIPVGFAAISIVAGTAGYFMYLPTLAPYSDASTVQLLSEGLFRSLGFLVLSMGTIESADPIAYTLLTLGRVSGFLFFFYAAVAGIGLLFAEQLRPLRIEIWSLLAPLPGFDDRGHIIICGIGDNGYSLATEALENGRNVVAIDIEQNDRTADLKTMGAIVLKGDASHEGVLARRARLCRAADVFVTAGSDATNGAIIETIDQQANDSTWSQVLDITARIDDNRLRRTFHEETMSTDGLHLRTYDVPEATARELLAAQQIDDIDDRNERIHVWLVGWTPLSEALINQLLHLMHYPDGVDRQVTVITDVPNKAERDITTLSPGIDPDWWDDESMSKFVEKLFPNIDVQSMPASDMELLSDQPSLYDSLEQNDKLTIIADDPDERSLRALISVWAPKLEVLSREFELDARLVYRSSDDTDRAPPTSEIQTTSYTVFGNGCSISSVRGEERDRIARQLALVYHLLYEEEPSAIFPWRESVPIDREADIESVIGWLETLPQAERERYETAVWRNLPEYQRESNRHAADHAAVKHRMAGVLADVDTTLDQQTIRALAESEHRRWCAEKILDGWEPLPSTEKERWKTDNGQQALREQRYHPDIRSVESLRAEMDGAWKKDVSQVKAVLNHPEIIGYQSNKVS